MSDLGYFVEGAGRGVTSRGRAFVLLRVIAFDDHGQTVLGLVGIAREQHFSGEQGISPSTDRGIEIKAVVQAEAFVIPGFLAVERAPGSADPGARTTTTCAPVAMSTSPAVVSPAGTRSVSPSSNITAFAGIGDSVFRMFFGVD